MKFKQNQAVPYRILRYQPKSSVRAAPQSIDTDCKSKVLCATGSALDTTKVFAGNTGVERRCLVKQ